MSETTARELLGCEIRWDDEGAYCRTHSHIVGHRWTEQGCQFATAVIEAAREDAKVCPEREHDERDCPALADFFTRHDHPAPVSSGEACPVCGGRGTVTQAIDRHGRRYINQPVEDREQVCDNCDGTGQIAPERKWCRFHDFHEDDAECTCPAVPFPVSSASPPAATTGETDSECSGEGDTCLSHGGCWEFNDEGLAVVCDQADTYRRPASVSSGEAGVGEHVHETHWGVLSEDGMAYGVTPNTREKAEREAALLRAPDSDGYSEPGAKVREVRNCRWAGVTLYDVPAPVIAPSAEGSE